MKKYLFPFLFVAAFLSLCANAQLDVVYPNINGLGKESFAYEVLAKALAKSGVDYHLSVTEDTVNNARIRLLIKEKKISIADFGTSPEFEQEFLPLYFPIDLGLNGWRVFLIHKDSQTRFDHDMQLEQLRQMTAGQGTGWSDVVILEHAGLPVAQSPHISNLIRMLNNKRFDYFPLGANEVHSLLAQYQGYGDQLMVEQDILLIYPFGRLFFVHKDNQPLYDAVKAGLTLLFESGEFFELFRQHPSHAAIFNESHLDRRTVIRIENPYMTKAFHRIPDKYFFSLDRINGTQPASP